MEDVRISLPPWLSAVPDPQLGRHAGDEARMAWLLDVLDRHIDEQTGGPFAAAVFAGEGALLGLGVNRVVPTATCVAHAEVIALASATQAVGAFTLDGRDATLVATAEPCAMCLGAVGWSGVVRLVCAAADADARAIGFDEGDKPAAWQDQLRARGVQVVEHVHRRRAAAALRRYVDEGGVVYNGAG